MFNEEYWKKEFENHEATFEKNVIHWRNKNGSSINYIYFAHIANTIVIAGDLGSAIYCNHTVSFEWLAKSSFSGYLDHKLEACSESTFSKKGYSWDYDTAVNRVKQLFYDSYRDKRCWNEKDREYLVNLRQLRNDFIFNLGSQYECLIFTSQHTEELEEIFGQDWYEYDFHEAGAKPSLRVYIHQLALNLILEKYPEYSSLMEYS